MQFNSGLTNETEVSVEMVFPNGRRLLVHRDKNRIMDASKAEILSSLYSASYAINRLTTFKVGSGGTSTVGGSDVKAVAGDRTALYTTINPAGNYTNTLSTPVVSTDGLEATYSFSIPDNALIGQYINEVALFKNNGVIFNMKTFPSILKVSGFSLAFTWKIRYK